MASQDSQAFGYVVQVSLVPPGAGGGHPWYLVQVIWCCWCTPCAGNSPPLVLAGSVVSTAQTSVLPAERRRPNPPLLATH